MPSTVSLPKSTSALVGAWPAVGLSSLLIVVGDYAMMSPHAAATGLPRHHQRVRAAATAATHRPEERRSDPRPPPPTRGPATPSRRAADPVRPGRPGLAGRAAAPTPPTRPAPPAAARTARHHPALAPRPARP